MINNMEGIAMARTYRRKNVPRHMIWTLYTYELEPDTDSCRRSVLDVNSREGRKQVALYRADSGFGDYAHACPPRWYRRQLNRRDARLEEQDLHRWLKDPDHEVLPRRWGRDARWFW